MRWFRTRAQSETTLDGAPWTSTIEKPEVEEHETEKDQPESQEGNQQSECMKIPWAPSDTEFSYSYRNLS